MMNSTRKKISPLHLHYQTLLAGGAGPRIVPVQELRINNLLHVILDAHYQIFLLYRAVKNMKGSSDFSKQ